MVRHTLRPTWLQAGLHGLVAILLSLLFWFSGLLQGIESKTFDLRAAISAVPSPASSSIILVFVDQESLEWVAENMGIVWPWPRELFSAVIDNCKRRGAKAIGFDVLFTESSPAGVADDNALVQSIKRAGAFALGSVFPTNSNAKFSSWPAAIPRPTLNIQIDDVAQDILPLYRQATFPISEIGHAVPVLCNVQHEADEDGIYRRIHPLVLFDQEPLPTLGLGVYLSAHPKADITVGKNRITVAGKNIPLDSTGATIPRYRGPHKTYSSLSAASFIRQEFRIKNGELDPAQVDQDLTDAYILVGYTAPGLFDLRPSPTDGVFSGVEINATMLDNLLTDDFIHYMPPAWTAALVIFFTLFTLLTLSLLSSLRSKILASSGLILLPIIMSLLFYRQGFDFKLIPVQLAVMTAATMSLFQGYFIALGRERFIRHSFKHYLSPAVIDQLISNPERLKLGGERKELTMFFSDLQGFTRISEGLAPEELTQMLNEYLTAMTDIILQEEGTVDKFEGDAIIAFWNAPLDITNHAEKAVRAALRCQEQLKAMGSHFHAKFGKQLVMRIGINTGLAIAGNMGSSTRFDYTVLGDAVNLAARLEGANKYFGTYTMISQTTFNQLGDKIHCRELARLRVVGRNEPVTVFEPLHLNTPPEEDHALFRVGLDLFYRGDFQKALAAFDKHSDRDPASARYLILCRQMLEKQPEHWDGIFDLEAK